MSDYSSVQTDLNGVQLEVELQPKTFEVACTSISKVIDTDGVYSEVELIEPTVVVTAEINKVCIRSPNRY